MNRTSGLLLGLVAVGGVGLFARSVQDRARRDEALRQAIELGSTADARALMSQGARLTGSPRDLLLSAIFKPDIPAVATLLELGADAGAAQDALNAAARAGAPEALGLLLAHGAKADLPGPGGNTPLHLAAGPDKAANRVKSVSPQLETVKILLANGAKATAKNGAGETPLSVSEDSDVARTLIAHGADPRDLAEALKKRLPERLAGVWMDCPQQPDQGCATHYRFAPDHGLIVEHNVALKTGGESVDGDWDYVLDKAERGTWALDDAGLALTFTDYDDKGVHGSYGPARTVRYPFADLAKTQSGPSSLRFGESLTVWRMGTDVSPAEFPDWEKVCKPLDERYRGAKREPAAPKAVSPKPAAPKGPTPSGPGTVDFPKHSL